MHSLGYGSKETASKRRQEFYCKTGLKVEVGEETLQISLGVDRISVSATVVIHASSTPLRL